MADTTMADTTTGKGSVLVTGGSGYVASFCIGQLLDQGWTVRTTVRSLAREAEVRATIARLTAHGDRLTMFAADLNADAGWREAAEGCAGVLHVASPLPLANPKDDDVLVKPARDGALRVLRAARDAGVRRVVMTSSTAAVCYGYGSRHEPYTEADWSDPTDRTDSSAYERSKMIAERAAWEWLQTEGGALELVTICPGAVLGPVLGQDFSASIDIVKKLLDGSLPGLPRFGWPLVDVRDIADLHLRALTAPVAAGKRYIGAGPFFWMSDIAQVLRRDLPGTGARAPKLRLPSWLVRHSARFDPVVRERLFELDKERPISAERARTELGWAPRSAAQSIVDTARSLIAEGLIKA
ncbi:aldehyde reductase [Novosphingobium sp.]|uniref:SDR family oxidoreductase n=1 Tax=Novosphingobium sp. TaxID=1874826 RepID=UPI00334131EA